MQLPRQVVVVRLLLLREPPAAVPGLGLRPFRLPDRAAAGEAEGAAALKTGAWSLRY